VISYLIQRLVSFVFVLGGAATIVFFIMHVAPADPARVVAGLRATPAQVEKVREEMGLNDPLIVQYGRYVRQILRGDLGTSIRTNRPIIKDLALYFPATLELVVLTTITFLTLGIGLGVLTAVYVEKRWITFPAKLLAIAGMGVPIFWLGLLAQVVFYSELGILPAVGRIAKSVPAPQHITGLFLLDSLITGNLAAFSSAFLHLILPTMTLASNRFGVTARFVREQMLNVLKTDYVRTAWSKGLKSRIVVFRHALRNALIPVVTMTGLQFGWLLGGTLLVESIFSYPGLGGYAFDAIAPFDFPAVIGTTLLLTLCFSVNNLLVDLTYMVIDPRIVYD